MIDLSGLKAKRTALTARLAGIADTSARLRSATTEENTILAEIGVLGRKEVEAVQRWAATGATGDMPEPDSAERARLHAALVAAQAKTASIGGALADFDREQAEVSTELAALNTKIDDLALDRLAERHAAEMTNLDTYIVEHLQPRMALHLALHAMLVERAQAHQAAGRTDQAMPLFRRAEALMRSYVQFDIGATQGEIVAKARVWRERYEQLVADKTNVVEIGSAAA